LTALTRYFEFAFILWNPDLDPTIWATLYLKVHQRFDFLSVQTNYNIFSNFKGRHTSKAQLPEF